MATGFFDYIMGRDEDEYPYKSALLDIRREIQSEISNTSDPAVRVPLVVLLESVNEKLLAIRLENPMET